MLLVPSPLHGCFGSDSHWSGCGLLTVVASNLLVKAPNCGGRLNPTQAEQFGGYQDCDLRGLHRGLHCQFAKANELGTGIFRIHEGGVGGQRKRDLRSGAVHTSSVGSPGGHGQEMECKQSALLVHMERRKV